MTTTEIQFRLDALDDIHPWAFNPTHEMFMGTTNAIEMHDRTLDLGRTGAEWELSKDPNTKGYIRTARSLKQHARTLALGKFLESCREDIRFLLVEVERLSK